MIKNCFVTPPKSHASLTTSDGNIEVFSIAFLIMIHSDQVATTTSRMFYFSIIFIHFDGLFFDGHRIKNGTKEKHTKTDLTVLSLV